MGELLAEVKKSIADKKKKDEEFLVFLSQNALCYEYCKKKFDWLSKEQYNKLCKKLFLTTN